ELIEHEDGGVTLSQRRYIDDILKRFGMEDCTSVSSPVDISTKLVASENQAPTADVPYREAVGALMHLIWRSKKQPSVFLSTSEAENVALSLAIQEGKWVHRLLCEILAAAGAEAPKLVIFEDNQSCIKVTKNPVSHGRAKHIDIKYHHIHDEVKSSEVEVEYCSTSTMLADLLAKAFPDQRTKSARRYSDVTNSVRE
ncbi:Integrase catalytic core protein, partial [Globisporangium polare]